MTDAEHVAVPVPPNATYRLQAEIDAAWDDVIDRRVASVVDGTATLVDGPASLAQIRSHLAARRM